VVHADADDHVLGTGPLHLDGDPVTGGVGHDLDAADGFLVLAALLDFDEHLRPVPGPHLNRPVERRQADLGRLAHGEALLLALDEGL